MYEWDGMGGISLSNSSLGSRAYIYGPSKSNVV